MQVRHEDAFHDILGGAKKNRVNLMLLERLSTEAAEPPPVAMPATLPPPSPCKDVVFYEPKEYSPGLQLYWASCARSLPDMAEALAHGAEVNWVNTEDDKRTPLIMAVQGVSVTQQKCFHHQFPNKIT